MSNTQNGWRASTALIAFAVGNIPAALMAQTATSSSDAAESEPASLSVDEIVVTAQKRTERLKDVPISIKALTGEDLEKSNISSLEGILSQTANVNISAGRNRSDLDLSIRGITPLTFDDSVARTFGVYIDGLNVASTLAGSSFGTGSGLNQRLLDIERVEVLRGPQSIYLGKNVIGGGISITTTKPSPGFSGSVSAEYSRFDSREIVGSINVPITGNIFIRASAMSFTSDGAVRNIGNVVKQRGYLTDDITNPYINDHLRKDFGFDSQSSSEKTKGARLAVRWLPTTELTVDLTYTYQRSKYGIPNATSLRVVQFAEDDVTTPDIIAAYGGLLNDGIGYYPENRRVAQYSSSIGDLVEQHIGSATVQYTNEILAATSITSYTDVQSNSDFDGDGSRANASGGFSYSKQTSFSQELRVVSTAGRPIEWLFGGFYSRDIERGVYAEVYDTIFYNPDNLAGSDIPNRDVFTYATASDRPGRDLVINKAVFGEVSWNATSRLKLSAGGRFSWDDQKRVGNVFDIFGTPLFSYRGPDAKYDEFTPRYSAVFKVTPDTTVYGTASKGYRQGSSNSAEIPNLPAEFQTFGPEYLWNYEAGVKTSLFNRRLSVNVSAFYMKYTDMQVPVPTPIVLPTGQLSSEAVIQNAGKATSKGIEIEFTARPARPLTVSGGIGYLDSSFDKGVTLRFLDGSTADISGQALPGARKWSFNLQSQLDFPIANNLDGFVRVEASAFSKSSAGVGLDRGRPGFELPSYHLINLRLGGNMRQTAISVYVENLLDEKYYTDILSSSEFSGTYVDVHPRVWGIRASRKF